MEVRDALGAVLNGESIDTGRDPRAVNELGRAIAGMIRDARPDAVICWVGDDESVLAHAVAADLGVPVLRAVEEMGLLTIEGAADRGIRVALVATRWGGRNPLEPLTGLVANSGLEPIALAALLGDPTVATAGIPTVILGAQ